MSQNTAKVVQRSKRASRKRPLVFAGVVSIVAGVGSLIGAIANPIVLGTNAIHFVLAGAALIFLVQSVLVGNSSDRSDADRRVFVAVIADGLLALVTLIVLVVVWPQITVAGGLVGLAVVVTAVLCAIFTSIAAVSAISST
ncbi:hypothetical protein ACWIGI_41205 [Nocardia sp. NPDC055321]